MTGETDLQRLLASMTPQLLPDVHVFATLAPGTAVPDGLDPVMQFREREGLTLIVSEDQAKVAGLAGTFRCRMITLDIHSSLDRRLSGRNHDAARRCRHGRQSSLGLLSRPSVRPGGAGGRGARPPAATGCGEQWLAPQHMENIRQAARIARHTWKYRRHPHPPAATFPVNGKESYRRKAARDARPVSENKTAEGRARDRGPPVVRRPRGGPAAKRRCGP